MQAGRVSVGAAGVEQACCLAARAKSEPAGGHSVLPCWIAQAGKKSPGPTPQPAINADSDPSLDGCRKSETGRAVKWVKEQARPSFRHCGIAGERCPQLAPEPPG